MTRPSSLLQRIGLAGCLATYLVLGMTDILAAKRRVTKAKGPSAQVLANRQAATQEKIAVKEWMNEATANAHNVIWYRPFSGQVRPDGSPSVLKPKLPDNGNLIFIPPASLKPKPNEITIQQTCPFSSIFTDGKSKQGRDFDHCYFKTLRGYRVFGLSDQGSPNPKYWSGAISFAGKKNGESLFKVKIQPWTLEPALIEKPDAAPRSPKFVRVNLDLSTGPLPPGIKPTVPVNVYFLSVAKKTTAYAVSTNTSFTALLPPGQYRVVLVHPQYETHVKTVRVPAPLKNKQSKPVTLAVTLIPEKRQPLAPPAASNPPAAPAPTTQPGTPATSTAPATPVIARPPVAVPGPASTPTTAAAGTVKIVTLSIAPIESGKYYINGQLVQEEVFRRPLQVAPGQVYKMQICGSSPTAKPDDANCEEGYSAGLTIDENSPAQVVFPLTGTAIFRNADKSQSSIRCSEITIGKGHAHGDDAPCKAALSPGAYKISIQRYGYSTFIAEINILPLQPTEVAVAFSPTDVPAFLIAAGNGRPLEGSIGFGVGYPQFYNLEGRLTLPSLPLGKWIVPLSLGLEYGGNGDLHSVAKFKASLQLANAGPFSLSLQPEIIAGGGKNKKSLFGGSLYLAFGLTFKQISILIAPGFTGYRMSPCINAKDLATYVDNKDVSIADLATPSEPDSSNICNNLLGADGKTRYNPIAAATGFDPKTGKFGSPQYDPTTSKDPNYLYQGQSPLLPTFNTFNFILKTGMEFAIPSPKVSPHVRIGVVINYTPNNDMFMYSNLVGGYRDVGEVAGAGYVTVHFPK